MDEWVLYFGGNLKDNPIGDCLPYVGNCRADGFFSGDRFTGKIEGKHARPPKPNGGIAAAGLIKGIQPQATIFRTLGQLDSQDKIVGCRPVIHCDGNSH